MTRVQPMLTEFTDRPRIQPERWQSIMIEAAEQRERLCLPELLALKSLQDCLADWPDD